MKSQPSTFILIFLAAIKVATAQPATEPFGESFVTDGVVQAMAKNGDTLYFGGGFNLVGVRTGGGVPVSATTAAAEPSFPMVNGLPGNAIPDGQGGWFVSGLFTVVGEYLRTNLVHIRSDRTVDPDWAPIATGGAVMHAVLDGNNLYIAGSFTNVNGQARNSVAVLDATTGALGAWNPNAVGGVSRIFLADSNLIVCGAFTSVNSQSRSYLAAINKTSGLLTSWNPNPSSTVQAMTINSNHLYVCGAFSTIASQSRTRLASFNLADYSIDPWSPAFASGSLSAIDSYQNQIFVSGQFTSIGGAFRTNVAALDAITGAATSWDAHQPYVTSSGFPINAISVLNVYSNAVYVAGPLISIGGQSRPYAAALDINTGSVLPWDPKPNQFPSVFCKVGNSIYLGGLFSAVGCIDRTNLAAFNLSSKQFTSWNPNLMTRSSIPVSAMVVANNQVFVGGFFTNVGGFTRTNLVALDLVNGSVQSWTPNPNGEIYSLATGNNRLFVGGTFTSIAGNAQNYFADFDLASGTLTGWNPTINAFVQALTVDGNTLYAGGLFTLVSSQTRRRIAALDLTSNSLTTWNANLTNGSYVDAISVSAGRVFIGGSFNVLNGSNRTNFAGLDAATAQVLPFVANTDSAVYGVEATTNMVFITGNFENVSSQKHSYLAALDLNSNTLANWNPNGDFYGKTVRIFDNNLYAGGAFWRMAGVMSRGIAKFPLSLVGAPSVVSKSVKRTAAGSFQFQCVAQGLPQVTVQTSSNLSTWQTAQVVPLVSGNGMFTESINGGTPSRFYRLSVP